MDNHGVARSARRQLTEAEKKRELRRIDKYNELVAQVREKREQNDYTSEALILTTALLSQNPEYYSIWNYRRLILSDVFSTELSAPPAPDRTSPTPALSPAQHEISLLIKEDLQLVTQLQRLNPKTYWLWNHRAWLLAQAVVHLPGPAAASFWQHELALVAKMLTMDARNFHGWSYRRTVVAALESLSATSSPELSAADQEFAYADSIVRRDFSNFSAWHHRMLYLRRRLTSADDEARRKAYEGELALASELLWLATDAADQSVWFYHGDLVAMLDPKEEERWGLARYTVEERRGMVGRQMDGVREVAEDNERCKWVYQSLLGLGEVQRALGGEVDADEMRGWLAKLEELDPLRKGRWRDWREKLGL